MTDRPIIFSAPMVRALLDGRKTQTRRITDQAPPECSINYMLGNESWLSVAERTPVRRAFEAWGGDLFARRPKDALCGSFYITPRCQLGDRLWVRERGWIAKSKTAFEPFVGNEALLAPQSPDGTPYKACPSIHMPRWASRLTLAVTGVRVERLQDITEVDAVAEGWPHAGRDAEVPLRDAYPIGWFANLWGDINGPDAWDANPWVAAISFTVHRANIDALDIGAAA